MFLKPEHWFHLFPSLCSQWGMLPCGHSLCMECVLELTRRAYYTVWQIRGGGSARLSCPLCRFSFLSSEINTVRPTEPEHMVGSHSL